MTRFWKRALVTGLALMAVAAGGYGVWTRVSDADPTVVRTGLAGQAPVTDLTDFERAVAPRRFDFPLDHGSHPDYQTEWWYYTGNLATADGRRFGFQLTFFRRALLPDSRMPERASAWASGQVYMAHFAVSDIGADRFQAYERLSRGAGGLAGALPGPAAADREQPFRVWLDDWQVIEAPQQTGCLTHSVPCRYVLQAAQANVALELNLTDERGPILQGDRGFSAKGPEAGQASYYYSLTRLKADGAITVDGRRYEVSGWSWMDHEWSTSALSSDQVGWDWFSIQLEQGIDLMVFQIRKADGSIDPFSSGLVIFPDGRTLPLRREMFTLEVQDQWTSPHSGASYPSEWRLVVPEADLDLHVQPRMADQELNVSYAYWEGAVQVEGRVADKPVTGSGYVELTGYSHSLGGEF